MQKVVPDAPHEILLVLDASTGQNAIEQARQFTAATEVNALALTKLDGTAKGGVVIGISDQFQIPVKYIGVGEKMEDLQVPGPEIVIHVGNFLLEIGFVTLREATGDNQLVNFSGFLLFGIMQNGIN